MLRRPFRCTSPSSTAAFQRKDTKEPLSWKVLGFLTALQLPSRPVHRWRAWLLSFGSFGAKSPNTIFMASWAKTRRENRIILFVQNCAGQILGVSMKIWRTLEQMGVSCVYESCTGLIVFAKNAARLQPSLRVGGQLSTGSACLPKHVNSAGH
jgi:hypothetical protein